MSSESEKSMKVNKEIKSVDGTEVLGRSESKSGRRYRQLDRINLTVASDEVVCGTEWMRRCRS